MKSLDSRCFLNEKSDLKNNQLSGPVAHIPSLLTCYLALNIALECPFPPNCEVCSCSPSPPCVSSRCIYPGNWSACPVSTPTPTPFPTPTPKPISKTATPKPTPALNRTSTPTPVSNRTQTPFASAPTPIITTSRPTPTPTPTPRVIVSTPTPSPTPTPTPIQGCACWIWITCDNSFDATWNGAYLASSVFSSSWTQSHRVLANFNVGRNVLALRGVDQSGVAAALVQVRSNTATFVSGLLRFHLEFVAQFSQELRGVFRLSKFLVGL
jgi:hypothetical protein